MNPSSATQLPFVSVVIPAFRRTAMLRKAVEGVFAQTYPADRYEVFVVDSSPEEDNVRMLATLAQYAPCAFRFERKKPEGPGPSRNAGAFRSRGDFIAFLDSDCCPAADWIINGVNAFAEGIGLVQGRTLPDPAERLGIFKWYLRVEQETPLYETANIFYRRAAFEQTGGFPSDLSPYASHPMGGEDVSVAWKMKRLGWKSFFSAQALVYHEVVPLRIRDWIWIKHLYIWPQLLKEFPELRAFMFHSWFFDRAQA
jgi:cellulose synthase/poly-beta-1,6-N-acetylglucosamine synthase-like glycosyltransferase